MLSLRSHYQLASYLRPLVSSHNTHSPSEGHPLSSPSKPKNSTARTMWRERIPEPKDKTHRICSMPTVLHDSKPRLCSPHRQPHQGTAHYGHGPSAGRRTCVCQRLGRGHSVRCPGAVACAVSRAGACYHEGLWAWNISCVSCLLVPEFVRATWFARCYFSVWRG